MAIYKAKIESNFATIPNSTLQDETLSYEATGLLAMMLSLPDDWEIHKTWLQSQKVKCGRDKLTGMMNELIEAGYVMRKVKQKECGLLDGVDWLVYPTVQLKNRKTVKPSDGKPVTTKETDLQKKHNTNSIVPSETKRSKFKHSDDDYRLAEWMWQRVKMINPAAREPNMKAWANTIRLMREVDERSHQQIGAAFDWANKDSFWCNNILSPEKLRKQYDTLTTRMMNNATNQQQSTNGSNRKLSAAEENENRLRELYGSNSVQGHATSSAGIHQPSNDGYLQQPMEARETTIELGADDWRTIDQ